MTNREWPGGQTEKEQVMRELSYTEIEAIIIRVTKKDDIYVMMIVDGSPCPAQWSVSKLHQKATINQE